MSTNEIREKNSGAIRELIGRLNKSIVVRVGIQGAEAGKQHEGVSIADIAVIHEFGLGNNPVRSWLRAWFDENESQLKEDIRRGYQKVIAGTINEETLATALGMKAVAGIQARISAGIAPPLSPDYLKRKANGKGGSTPLIDTGLFRSSVTFVLESGDMIGGFIP